MNTMQLNLSVTFGQFYFQQVKLLSGPTAPYPHTAVSNPTPNSHSVKPLNACVKEASFPKPFGWAGRAHKHVLQNG